MRVSHGVRTGRFLAVSALVVLLCGAAFRAFSAAAVSALEAVRESGPDAPADLLVLGAAAVGLLLVLWLGLGVLLAILATLPGGAGRLGSVAAEWVTPAIVRRVTAVLVGTTLAATGMPVVHAEPSPAPTATAVRITVAPAPDPAFRVTTRAPVPDAPVARRDIPATPTRTPTPTPTPTPMPAPDPAFGAPGLGPLAPVPRTAPPTRGTVTVAAGDSLWAIAARHLGAGATRQQIAHEWPRWYAANRALIGPDPHLIRVGQVLMMPAPTS